MANDTLADPATATAEDADHLPALVVTFGSTARKRRPLLNRTSVLGKARTADIRLDAPDVAAIHCVLSRDGDGLNLRDCGSRNGTLVNDQPVRETRLTDGDRLQVGPFSFQVSVPASAGDGAAEEQDEPSAFQGIVDEARVRTDELETTIAERDEQLAKLRERLEIAQGDLADAQRRTEDAGPTVPEADIEQRVRDAVSARTESLYADEVAPLRQHVQELERSLEQKDARVAELQSKLEQPAGDGEHTMASGDAASLTAMQHRVAELEGQLAQAKTGDQGDSQALRERIADLEGRVERSAQDAERTAALKKRVAELAGQSEQARQDADERVARLQEQNAELEDRLERGGQDSSQQIQGFQDRIADLEGRLEQAGKGSGEQIQTLQKRIAELEGQLEQTGSADAESQAFQERIAALEGQLAEAAAADGAIDHTMTSDDAAMLAALESEKEALAEQVRQVEARLQEQKEANERRLTALKGKLQAEQDQVKQLVRETAAHMSGDKAAAEAVKLRQQVERLKAELAEKTGPDFEVPKDLQDYEEQLNQFRNELETAQAEVERQQAELDSRLSGSQEKIREHELALSKERADLARERSVLQKTRNELKVELEHAEREARNLNQMAPIRRLTDEMRGGRGGPAHGDDRARAEDSTLSTRIRSLMRRIGEG